MEQKKEWRWGKAHTRMLISIFVGFLGLDRFYDRQIGWGVLKGATLGALVAWWVADAAYYTYLAGKGE